MNFIEDHQGESLPDAGDGSQQVEGVVIVLSGGFFDMPFEFFKDLIKGLYDGQVDLDAFADLGVGEALGNAVMVVFA